MQKYLGQEYAIKKCQRNSYKGGFLSIDIAFSLLILSFVFVLLSQVQGSITKQLNTRDIQNFYEASDNLFHNIKHSVCRKYTLKTSNNHVYDMCRVEGIARNAVTLRYYVIHGFGKQSK